MRPALVMCGAVLLLVVAFPALAQFTVSPPPSERPAAEVGVRLLLDDAALHVELSIPMTQLRFSARPQVWSASVQRWVLSLIEALHSYMVAVFGRTWHGPIAMQPS